MKKHILLLGIFLNLTVSLSVQAGNTVIDSLKQEIRQAEREPSSKEKLIELYQFLGAEYETLDHDSSYHYIQKGLSLYPLLNSLANYLFMEGKLEQAKETFKTVAAHAPKLKERRYDLEGVVESSIGVCYRKLGMFDSAVYHYNRALDFCKKTEKYEDIASTYYNIGVLYHLNKRYEEALEGPGTRQVSGRLCPKGKRHINGIICQHAYRRMLLQHGEICRSKPDSKKKCPKSIRDRISPTCHELPKPPTKYLSIME